MKPRTTPLRRAWNALQLVAALLLLAPPIRAQDLVLPLPAQPICKDGKLVGITVEVPIPGRITFLFPPGMCALAKPPPKPPPKST